MTNIPNDVAIISGNNEEIQTNKYLWENHGFTHFGSGVVIRNLHDIIIINSVFSVTDKLSNEDVKEIIVTAQSLSIDITEFCCDENVPSLIKSNVQSILVTT